MSGLRLLTGADLPPLGWQHTEPLDVGRIGPIVDFDMMPKPKGGLWTATVRYENGVPVATSWTDWCRSEHYGTPTAPVTLIVPDRPATVYRIDSTADLKELEAAYHRPSDIDLRMWPQMSWTRIAADIDAVWLTDAGQWATRFSQPGLYGWDCETVLWLNPRFTVGDTITLPEETPDE